MTTYILLGISAGLVLLFLILCYRRTQEKEVRQKCLQTVTEIKQQAIKNFQVNTPKLIRPDKELEDRYTDHILTATERRNFVRPYTSLYRETSCLLQKMTDAQLPADEELYHMNSLCAQAEKLVDAHNEKVKKKILKLNKDFFDHCLQYPLDGQQRRAIISEEENCLVISSAGSGKTSSIVGKVKYLTQIKGIKPNRILLISYTNKAAAELTERIHTPGLYGYTFHKLALNLIARYKGTKPNLCDQTDLLFIRIYRQMVQDHPEFREAVLSYFVDYPNDDELWARKKRERQEKLTEDKQVQQKSIFPDMDGNIVRVKSAQEKKLCFILTALGVDFRYEEPYEHTVEDEMHAQYQPDFSIYYTKDGKQHRIYLEHFGIDEHGLVPLWFAQDKNMTYEEANRLYGDGISWKRETHRKFGTTLVSTSSADFKYLDVKKELKQKLKQAGVPIHEKTPEELFHAVLPKQSSQEKSFIRFVITFITLLKSSCKSVTDILQSADQAGDNRAVFIIKNIFDPIYETYQHELYRLKQIDFTDAILQATQICKSQVLDSYDYIIVDEFQDISMDRYAFLKALRRGNPPAKLFCVGDDWQSIYRFSGSDMSLFSKFPKYFGPTEMNKIETTYRFGHPLVDYSSWFIQCNRNQLRKDIHPYNTQVQTLLLFQAYQRANYCLTLENLLKTIPADKSVFLLGRYSFDDYYLSFKYKTIREGNKTFYVIQGRKMEFLTVHKSKGLEADYVILLQCNKDNFGFPSLIQDDPILNYVLSEKDEFQFSEERRLFYVAMTRAKVCTYIFYDERFPSVFVQEFLQPKQLTDLSYKKHRNANFRWTKKADMFLLSLHQEKKSIAYISQKMGRSQTSIVMRLNKLLSE